MAGFKRIYSRTEQIWPIKCLRTRPVSVRRVRFHFLFARPCSQVPHLFPYMSGHMQVIHCGSSPMWRMQMTYSTHPDTPHTHLIYEINMRNAGQLRHLRSLWGVWLGQLFCFSLMSSQWSFVRPVNLRSPTRCSNLCLLIHLMYVRERERHKFCYLKERVSPLSREAQIHFSWTHKFASVRRTAMPLAKW